MHGLEVSAIDEGATLTPTRHAACILELLEMEGERGGGQAQLGRDVAGGESLAAAPNQQPEYIEAGLLGEGVQSSDGDLFFHNSKVMEL